MISAEDQSTQHARVFLYPGSVEARIDALTPEGARVAFDFTAPVLGVGSTIRLQIAAEDGTARQVDALVRSRADEDSARAYHVVFLAPDVRSMPDMCRRSDPRAEPGPQEQVRVILRVDARGACVVGTLDDLSTTGAGIIVPRSAERVMGGIESVGVVLELTPGWRHDIEGQIRWRTLVGPRIHYGIAFTSSSSPQYGAFLRDVRTWVRRHPISDES